MSFNHKKYWLVLYNGLCYLNNIFPLTNAGVLPNRVCAFYYDYYYTEINTRKRPHTKLCIRVLERTIQTQAFWLNCALVPVEVDSSNPDSYQGRKNSNSVPMFMFVCCVCFFYICWSSHSSDSLNHNCSR